MMKVVRVIVNQTSYKAGVVRSKLFVIGPSDSEGQRHLSVAFRHFFLPLLSSLFQSKENLAQATQRIFMI